VVAVTGPVAAVGAGGDAASAFTACMRSHGLEDFPPARVTDDGRLGLDASGTVEPFSTAYRDALDACDEGLPDGVALPNRPRVPDLTVPAPGPGDHGDGDDVSDDGVGDRCPAPAPPAPPAPPGPPGRPAPSVPLPG
jgi:hypothetical protein